MSGVEVDDTVAARLLLPGDATWTTALTARHVEHVVFMYGNDGATVVHGGDFSGDGQVDGTDLNIVLSNYGGVSNATAVPLQS